MLTLTVSPSLPSDVCGGCGKKSSGPCHHDNDNTCVDFFFGTEICPPGTTLCTGIKSFVDVQESGNVASNTEYAQLSLTLSVDEDDFNAAAFENAVRDILDSSDSVSVVSVVSANGGGVVVQFVLENANADDAVALSSAVHDGTLAAAMENAGLGSDLVVSELIGEFSFSGAGSAAANGGNSGGDGSTGAAQEASQAPSSSEDAAAAAGGSSATTLVALVVIAALVGLIAIAALVVVSRKRKLKRANSVGVISSATPVVPRGSTKWDSDE